MDAAKDVARDAAADRIRDASTLDANESGPTLLSLVQSAHANNENTTTVSTTLSPVTRGSFLAVLTTSFGVGPSISSMVDNAPGGSNTYVSANLRSIGGTCQASEIWYVRNAQPGATSVTVTMSGNVTLAVWVLEVSGMATSGGVEVGAMGSGPATNTITAPTVDPSITPALVVSALGSCGTIGSLAGGNPFIALPEQNNNEAAYLIATAPEAYGPVFGNSYSGWNASVAAFR